MAGVYYISIVVYCVSTMCQGCFYVMLTPLHNCPAVGNIVFILQMGKKSPGAQSGLSKFPPGSEWQSWLESKCFCTSYTTSAAVVFVQHPAEGTGPPHGGLPQLGCGAAGSTEPSSPTTSWEKELQRGKRIWPSRSSQSTGEMAQTPVEEPIEQMQSITNSLKCIMCRNDTAENPRISLLCVSVSSAAMISLRSSVQWDERRWSCHFSRSLSDTSNSRLITLTWPVCEFPMMFLLCDHQWFTRRCSHASSSQ